MIPNLGIDVPFVIDAYAKNYVAASSEQLKITSNTDTLPKSIVLGERGGAVVVQLRDKPRFSGVPVGKILLRAKFDQGVVEQEATVVSGQGLSLQLAAL